MDDDIRQVLQQFYLAVNRLQQGDATLMLSLWSHRPDVTHMGPRGGRQQGWNQLQAYWQEAAEIALTAPGAVTAEGRDFVIAVSGDFAYTSAIEHVEVIHADQTSRFAARSTHIYRREADEWKLLHRHADAAPAT